MLDTDWNPWSRFLMLDYFSRTYFVGVLCVVGLGCATFLRIMLSIRARNSRGDASDDTSQLNVERMYRNLHSIQSLAMALTSGCCVNQIFGVWFTYMARVTDANPFFALREAWVVAQILMCLIILLDALRRYVAMTIERNHFRASA